MNASNTIAAISAFIAALGLVIAFMQFRDKRRAAETEAARLAQQQERLRTAASGAMAAAETADTIVQRAKEGDATVSELQSMARVLRQTVSLLASQLSDEDQEVKAWRKELTASREKSKKRTTTRGKP